MNFNVFNQLQHRIMNKRNQDMSFEHVILFNEVPALYDDSRFAVESDNFFTVDSREADDGDDYYATIEDRVWVNFSGRFIVPNEYKPKLLELSEEPDDRIGIYTYTDEPDKREYIDIDFLGEFSKFSPLIIPFTFDNSKEE